MQVLVDQLLAKYNPELPKERVNPDIRDLASIQLHPQFILSA